MLPHKLWHHVKRNHSESKGKRTEYFKCRCDEFIKCQKLFIMAFQPRKAKPLEDPAGRQLVECAPSQKVPLAERPVSLQADAADCWLAREPVEDITAAPLYNDTVACEIKDLAANRKAELIPSLQNILLSHKWANQRMCPDSPFCLCSTSVTPTRQRSFM